MIGFLEDVQRVLRLPAEEAIELLIQTAHAGTLRKDGKNEARWILS